MLAEWFRWIGAVQFALGLGLGVVLGMVGLLELSLARRKDRRDGKRGTCSVMAVRCSSCGHCWTERTSSEPGQFFATCSECGSTVRESDQ